MSATTTDPTIDVTPGPGVVQTTQDIEEEIMREWDGVTHFDDSDDPLEPGATFIALCGEEVACAGQFEADEETMADECPLCRAAFNALHP